jgi:hypothetical protein
MLKSFFTKATIVFLLIYLTFSCTFYSTKSKMPNFKVERAKMEENLKTLVTCENVDVRGMDINVNEKVSTELQVSIINGSNIPTDESKLKSLGKSIDSLYKQELSNVNEFNTFKVFFVVSKRDGIVTTSSSRFFAFKSDEL